VGLRYWSGKRRHCITASVACESLL